MGKWRCRSRSEDSEALEGRRQELEGEASGGKMRVGPGSEERGYEGRSRGNNRE